MLNVKTLTAAALLAVASASVASAADFQDKAVDKSGKAIVDARGNCVYTKWTSKDNACTPGQMVKKPLQLSREERTVYFDFNKSTIKASEKGKLDALVKAVKGAKEVESVDIVGHADKIGTTGYNNALSRKRAEAVRSYIAKSGVKIRNVDLRAVGESQSVTNCPDSLPRAERIACLAEDRRVEVELNVAK